VPDAFGVVTLPMPTLADGVLVQAPDNLQPTATLTQR
jgi:hypothetical protein